MNNLLAVPSKAEADTSDALSTPDNSNQNFDGENSPLFQTRNSEDGDSCSVTSKKIRKKRNAYQKIDDNIRVRLLESVQQGETLKAAAKRFNINYSSAKSILHTYRKEGRILKKSGQDKFFMGEEYTQTEPNLTPEQILQSASLTQNPFLQQKMLANPESIRMDLTGGPKIDLNSVPLSPSHGLAESFGSLLKLGSGNMMPQHPSSIFAKFSPRFSPSMMQASHDALNHQANILGINMSPANTTNLSQMIQGNPLDKLKYYDNFYMNYSNSPLSGGGRLMTESTDSSKHSSRPTSQREFESFSEMVNALQNQPRQAEDLLVPHAIRMNTAHLLQERLESRLGGGMEWEGTIENAAMDTYKSFMDAQLLLHDALKKASYLNNLVQIQKSKAEGSPMFAQLQGFKNN